MVAANVYELDFYALIWSQVLKPIINIFIGQVQVQCPPQEVQYAAKYISTHHWKWSHTHFPQKEKKAAGMEACTHCVVSLESHYPTLFQFLSPFLLETAQDLQSNDLG
jgi:hypothetical protein